MADIELIIKIPEVYFEALKKTEEIVSGQRSGKTFMSVIYERVANGTPLPKGHGRLIDADALKMDKKVCGDRYLSKTSLFVANKVIEQADTIIEADKTEGGEE